MMVKGHINKTLKRLRDEESKTVENLQQISKNIKFEKRLIKKYNEAIRIIKKETRDYAMANNITKFITNDLTHYNEITTEMISWRNKWSMSENYPSDIWNNDAAKWCAKHINHDDDIVRSLAKFGMEALKHKTEDAIQALLKVGLK